MLDMKYVCDWANQHLNATKGVGMKLARDGIVKQAGSWAVKASK